MAACKGCNARIYWARTKSGAAMPLDPQPVDGGNIEFAGTLAVVVRAQPGVKRHVVHYVSCPDAVKQRKASGVRLR